MLGILVGPNRAEVHAVCKKRVTKKVFDTVEGVTVEQEHWFVSRIARDADPLYFPVGDLWEQLHPPTEGLRSGE